MRATADLTLRESAPAGLLNSTGKQTGVLHKGTTVYASECKVVKDLFGSYRWYRVQVPDANGKLGTAAWVYTGTTGGVNYLQTVPGKAAPVCQ